MIDKPHYMNVPTFRNYEDYCDAVEYAHGWNDAMHFIFDSAEEQRKKYERDTECLRKKL